MVGMGDASATYASRPCSGESGGELEGVDTYVSVELQYPLLRHLVRPHTRGEDKGVRCPRLLSVRAELLSLPRGLPTRPGNDENVLKTVLIKGIAGEADRVLAFVVGEVLCLSVAALYEYSRHTSLKHKVTERQYRRETCLVEEVRTDLGEAEDVSLDRWDIKIFVLVEEEDRRDVDARGWRWAVRACHEDQLGR